MLEYGLLRIIRGHSRPAGMTRNDYFTLSCDIFVSVWSNRRISLSLFSAARQWGAVVTRNVHQGFTCRAQQLNS
ncbi:hypothetical protein KPLM21_60025 [Klebsiella pneumoniae]|nr:hypothetical protein KPLM21_60025 [Klebsiella pneumoniae]CTQ30463.1 hypothetical protein CH1034_350159 [Klebsiella pneumoniae]SAL92184.1 hypothetical protein KPHVMX_380161 [Klebsiella pneumoniae]